MSMSVMCAMTILGLFTIHIHYLDGAISAKLDYFCNFPQNSSDLNLVISVLIYLNMDNNTMQ